LSSDYQENIQEVDNPPENTRDVFRMGGISMYEPRMELSRHGRTLVIRLGGDLDVAMAPALRDRIDEGWLRSGAAHLLLDLSQVTFLDSTGLGVILGRYRRVQQMGGRMGLVAPPDDLVPTLRLSGIYQLMRVFATEQEALAAMEGVAG
jgi:stage II sporulation protein AA (anti-sigma F factor antagonist)